VTILLDGPFRFILERIPTRRIGPHGAHRQQKVDSGSYRTVGLAYRRGLVGRKRRHLLKRSISVVQNKARSLGKPFPLVASARRSALEASDR
jgi:hypothetical protein